MFLEGRNKIVRFLFFSTNSHDANKVSPRHLLSLLDRSCNTLIYLIENIFINKRGQRKELRKKGILTEHPKGSSVEKEFLNIVQQKKYGRVFFLASSVLSCAGSFKTLPVPILRKYRKGRRAI